MNTEKKITCVVDGYVRGAVYCSVWDSVGESVWNSVGESVRNPVWLCVYASVEAAVNYIIKEYEY